MIGLFLHYWYFKKHKKEVKEKIEEASKQNDNVNIIINIPQENKPDQEIVITQENLENAANSDDSLMWELQSAAMGISERIYFLKDYEIKEDQVNKDLKTINETVVRVATIISKGKIENQQDKQFSKDFINSANTILSTILPKIEKKMELIMMGTGQYCQLFIRTLTGKKLTIESEYFENKQDNQKYFSTDEVLQNCVNQWNRDQPIAEQISNTDLRLILGGKYYPNKTFIPSKLARDLECWHLIVRLE